MTTIVSVRRNNQVDIAGDGQVSLGNTVMKGNARKVRRLYHNKVLAGFAGGTADAFTLFERFEAKLEMHQGHLTKAASPLVQLFLHIKIDQGIKTFIIIRATVSAMSPNFTHHPKWLTGFIILFTPVI